MELNKNELLNYLKTRVFPLIDCTKLNDIEIINETYNPFDTTFNCKIVGDNDLLITVDKIGDKYQIRVGKNTGWIGGLMYTNNLEVFNLNEFTTESLIKGFEMNENNQKYTLCSFYGSNVVRDMIMVGTVKEIDEYCLKLSYQKKKAYEGYAGTFKEFYYVNDGKILNLLAL